MRTMFFRRIEVSALLGLLALPVACVDGPGAPRPSSPEEQEIPRAACDTPVRGIDLSNVPEGQRDIVAELAALEELAPEQRAASFPVAVLAPFIREIVAYALEVAPAELADLELAELIAGSPMKRGIALAFVRGDAVEGGVRPDILTLRRALHRFYLCERQLPLHLADLKSIVGYDEGAEPTIIEDSVPKAATRRLTSNGDGTAFFAESVVHGAVRETEVLWSGQRKDGALEFLAYDSNGNLEDGSYFATSEGVDVPAASPYTCMQCHRDHDGGTGFNVVFPAIPTRN